LDFEKKILEMNGKLNIWDYVKSINEKKEYYDEVDGYVPFIVNRALALNVDTVLFANEMNLYPDIEKKWQYDYFYHSVRCKRRYNKWIKDSKDEELEMVMKYFKTGKSKAREALAVLTSSDLKSIKQKVVGTEDVV